MIEFPSFRGIAKTSPGFRAELLRMAQRLGLDAEPIAAVMGIESGFDPRAVNPSGGATGLIQFIPSTARMLGTTTAALFDMSATNQLRFVEKFFRLVGLQPGAREGDYYVAIFMPAFIGKPDDAEIAAAGSRVYEVNTGLDRNRDGVITVGDVRAVLESELARARAAKPIQIDPNASDVAGGSGLLLPALVVGAVALNWKEVRKWMRKHVLS